MAEKSMIEAIKTLRERTGAGMMDCKKALLENDMDIEKSIDWLREKGIAKQAKRAGRIAAEGLTNVKISADGKSAAIVEVNCETDFVAGSDTFINLVNDVTDIVLEKKPKDLEEAKALTKRNFDDAALAVGEKLDFRRFDVVTKKDDEGFATYIHMAGKISVLAVLSKDDQELAKPIAMHIAANSPLYIELSDVPAADRERETNVAKAEVAADPKLQNKPEQVKEGIVARKVDKTLSKSCLALQPYLMDESKTVGEFLKEKGLKVVSFERYQVGEGIAKPAAE
jgi:elongation factor Ts